MANSRIATLGLENMMPYLPPLIQVKSPKASKEGHEMELPPPHPVFDADACVCHAHDDGTLASSCPSVASVSQTLV